MKEKFSHISPSGNPSMVDVGQKEVSNRRAVARAIIRMPPEVIIEIKKMKGKTRKGPIFDTAILAGIMACKKTSELIPLCHPLPLNKCQVDIDFLNESEIELICTAKVDGKTGVEMEALTGASIAALTIYDMCKAMTHNMQIRSIELVEKTGGKSDYQKPIK